MRTFRLIGMALLAIVLCVNFASCSSDDDGEPTQNDDGVVTNQKKLTQIKMVDDDGISIWNFSYDSKGRLVFKKGGVTGNTNYTWGSNVIMADDNNSTRTYTLSNNLVKSISDTDDNDWSNAIFTYNSNNQLAKVEDDTHTEIYTWQGERITKITSTYQYGEKYIDEFTYSGKTCKGYFPLYSPSDNDEIFYVHPELIGLRCSQLPDQVSSKDDNYEEISKYTYTFDKDGYVESCTKVYTFKDLSSNRTETDTTVFTFTWE